jgi:hypothetical protein
MSHKIKTIFIGKWGLVKGDIRVNIDLSRFDKQYQEAQTALDRAVMTGMEKYMPKVTGNFIQRTKAISESMAGSGRVCAGAGPMGRFLYEGMKMVDSETGRGPYRIMTEEGAYIFRFRKGAKLRATDTPLNFTKTSHPDVQAHWFEPAKEEFGSAWVKLAKEKAGGGKRG